MAESGFRGKSMKQIVTDVADGYISINPLFLKKFDKDMIKDLHEHLNKAMTAARNISVDLHDPLSVRMKNTKLQRLHSALIILKNTAREKRVPL